MPIITQPNRFPNTPKKPGVYLITNSYNDKEYVGQTDNLNKVISSFFGLNGESNGVLRGIDITKCTFTILETTEYLDKDQRLQISLEWIVRLNTIHPSGYNKRCPVYKISFAKKQSYLDAPDEEPKKYKRNFKKRRQYIPKYKSVGKNVLRHFPHD